MSSFYHRQMPSPWRINALTELVRAALDEGLSTVACDDPIAISAGRTARSAFRHTEVTALAATLTAEGRACSIVETATPADAEPPIVDAFGRSSTGYTLVFTPA